MSEQCMRSCTDTKYYDNVVLSKMMDVKQHDLAAPRTHTHTPTSTPPAANSVKSSHALYKAPWQHTSDQTGIGGNGV